MWRDSDQGGPNCHACLISSENSEEVPTTVSL